MERLSGPQQAEGDAGGALVRVVAAITRSVRMVLQLACGTGFPACLLTDWKVGPTSTGGFCEFTGVHFHGPNQ